VSTNQPPLVSIILPTHNRAALLREAVDSVIAQTFPGWELIIIDDGSTDETRQYLRCLTDDRIRVIESDHCGLPAKLRNVGLRGAKGRYIAFLDSDDVWAKTKLEVQLADLERKPAVRWSYTYYDRIDDRGDPKPAPKGFTLRACEGWIFEELVTLAAKVTMPTVVVERTLLDEAGGFDETLRFSEDYELWLRLARRSRVSVVTQPLAAVRDHAGNTSRAHGAKPLEFWVLVYDRLLGDPALRAFRRTCRRMRARATASLADRYRAERRYGDAIRVLLRSLPLGVSQASWWTSLVKTCLRPITPQPVVRLYRKLATSLRHS
jgi:GT2 family glycosyltransferase